MDHCFGSLDVINSIVQSRLKCPSWKSPTSDVCKPAISAFHTWTSKAEFGSNCAFVVRVGPDLQLEVKFNLQRAVLAAAAAHPLSGVCRFQPWQIRIRKWTTKPGTWNKNREHFLSTGPEIEMICIPDFPRVRTNVVYFQLLGHLNFPFQLSSFISAAKRRRTTLAAAPDIREVAWRILWKLPSYT